MTQFMRGRVRLRKRQEGLCLRLQSFEGNPSLPPVPAQPFGDCKFAVAAKTYPSHLGSPRWLRAARANWRSTLAKSAAFEQRNPALLTACCNHSASKISAHLHLLPGVATLHGLGCTTVVAHGQFAGGDLPQRGCRNEFLFCAMDLDLVCTSPPRFGT